MVAYVTALIAPGCWLLQTSFYALCALGFEVESSQFDTKRRTMWFTLVLTLCFLSPIRAYSSGAGQAVCQTNEMKPRRSGINFVENDPSINIDAVKNGNILDITVQSNNGFKGMKVVNFPANLSNTFFYLGYLIAVEKDGKQVGEFIISGHKAMGCATQNSGITHSNASSKRSVKGKWQIPANLRGSVVEVRATLVYQYSRAGHQRASIKL